MVQISSLLVMPLLIVEFVLQGTERVYFTNLV